MNKLYTSCMHKSRVMTVMQFLDLCVWGASLDTSEDMFRNLNQDTFDLSYAYKCGQHEALLKCTSHHAAHLKKCGMELEA